MPNAKPRAKRRSRQLKAAMPPTRAAKRTRRDAAVLISLGRAHARKVKLVDDPRKCQAPTLTAAKLQPCRRQSRRWIPAPDVCTKYCTTLGHQAMTETCERQCRQTCGYVTVQTSISLTQLEAWVGSVERHASSCMDCESQAALQSTVAWMQVCLSRVASAYRCRHGLRGPCVWRARSHEM